MTVPLPNKVRRMQNVSKNILSLFYDFRILLYRFVGDSQGDFAKESSFPFLNLKIGDDRNVVVVS
jgi:hypothetical protein